MERGLVNRADVLAGTAARPPFLRAFARGIRAARGAPASRRPRLLHEGGQAGASVGAMAGTVWPTATEEDGIRLLVEEARALREEGHAAEALRAAEGARDEAQALGHLALAVVAAAEVARARATLGDPGGAVAAWAWIVGVAEDGTRAAPLLDEGARRAVADAYAENRCPAPRASATLGGPPMTQPTDPAEHESASRSRV